MGFAWSAYRKRYVHFVAVMFAFFACWVALEIIVAAGQRLGIVLWVIAHIAFLFVVAGIGAGLVRTCLALCDGEERALRDTFAHMDKGPWLLAGQVLYLIITVGGAILLVVPGAYLAVRYAFFAFPIASGRGIAASFRQSALAATGVKARLFVILLGLFCLNVLGAALLGLGLLVTAPLSLLTMSALYRQLSSGQTEQQGSGASVPQ